MEKLKRIKELTLAMELALKNHEELDTELESIIDSLTPAELDIINNDADIIAITDRINKFQLFN